MKRFILGSVICLTLLICYAFAIGSSQDSDFISRNIGSETGKFEKTEIPLFKRLNINAWETLPTTLEISAGEVAIALSAEATGEARLYLIAKDKYENIVYRSIVINNSSDTTNELTTFEAVGSLTPATDDTYDLGTTETEWKDLYVDGTANIDTLAGTTMSGNLAMGSNNISGGGTITGNVLTDGTASMSAGSITSLVDLTASGTLSAVGVTASGTIDATGQITGGTISDGTASLTSGSITGLVDLTASGTITAVSLTATGTMVADSLALVPATDPPVVSGTPEGTVWYDDTLKKLRVYVSSWETISSSN